MSSLPSGREMSWCLTVKTPGSGVRCPAQVHDPTRRTKPSARTGCRRITRVVCASRIIRANSERLDSEVGPARQDVVPRVVRIVVEGHLEQLFGAGALTVDVEPAGRLHDA